MSESIKHDSERNGNGLLAHSVTRRTALKMAAATAAAAVIADTAVDAIANGGLAEAAVSYPVSAVSNDGRPGYWQPAWKFSQVEGRNRSSRGNSLGEQMHPTSYGPSGRYTCPIPSFTQVDLFKNLNEYRKNFKLPKQNAGDWNLTPDLAKYSNRNLQEKYGMYLMQYMPRQQMCMYYKATDLINEICHVEMEAWDTPNKPKATIKNVQFHAGHTNGSMGMRTAGFFGCAGFGPRSMYQLVVEDLNLMPYEGTHGTVKLTFKNGIKVVSLKPKNAAEKLAFEREEVGEADLIVHYGYHFFNGGCSRFNGVFGYYGTVYDGRYDERETHLDYVKNPNLCYVSYPGNNPHASPSRYQNWSPKVINGTGECGERVKWPPWRMYWRRQCPPYYDQKERIWPHIFQAESQLAIVDKAVVLASGIWGADWDRVQSVWVDIAYFVRKPPARKKWNEIDRSFPQHPLDYGGPGAGEWQANSGKAVLDDGYRHGVGSSPSYCLWNEVKVEVSGGSVNSTDRLPFNIGDFDVYNTNAYGKTTTGSQTNQIAVCPFFKEHNVHIYASGTGTVYGYSDGKLYHGYNEETYAKSYWLGSDEDTIPYSCMKGAVGCSQSGHYVGTKSIVPAQDEHKSYSIPYHVWDRVILAPVIPVNRYRTERDADGKSHQVFDHISYVHTSYDPCYVTNKHVTSAPQAHHLAWNFSIGFKGMFRDIDIPDDAEMVGFGRLGDGNRSGTERNPQAEDDKLYMSEHAMAYFRVDDSRTQGWWMNHITPGAMAAVNRTLRIRDLIIWKTPGSYDEKAYRSGYTSMSDGKYDMWGISSSTGFIRSVTKQGSSTISFFSNGGCLPTTWMPIQFVVSATTNNTKYGHGGRIYLHKKGADKDETLREETKLEKTLIWGESGTGFHFGGYQDSLRPTEDMLIMWLEGLYLDESKYGTDGYELGSSYLDDQHLFAEMLKKNELTGDRKISDTVWALNTVASAFHKAYNLGYEYDRRVGVWPEDGWYSENGFWYYATGRPIVDESGQPVVKPDGRYDSNLRAMPAVVERRDDPSEKGSYFFDPDKKGQMLAGRYHDEETDTYYWLGNADEGYIQYNVFVRYDYPKASDDGRYPVQYPPDGYEWYFDVNGIQVGTEEDKVILTVPVPDDNGNVLNWDYTFETVNGIRGCHKIGEGVPTGVNGWYRLGGEWYYWDTQNKKKGYGWVYTRHPGAMYGGWEWTTLHNQTLNENSEYWFWLGPEDGDGRLQYGRQWLTGPAELRSKEGYMFLGGVGDGHLHLDVTVGYDDGATGVELPPKDYEWLFNEDGIQVCPEGGEDQAVEVWSRNEGKLQTYFWNFEFQNKGGLKTKGCHKIGEGKLDWEGWRYEPDTGKMYYYEEHEPVKGWKWLPYHYNDGDATWSKVDQLGVTHKHTDSYWFYFDESDCHMWYGWANISHGPEDGAPGIWWLGERFDGHMHVAQIVKNDWPGTFNTMQDLPPDGYERYFGEDGRQVKPAGGDSQVPWVDGSGNVSSWNWHFETESIDGKWTIGCHKIEEGGTGTGWQITAEGDFYYLDSNMQRLKGWQYLDHHSKGKSTWTWYDGKGNAHNQDSKYWFYFDPDTGKMVTGRQYIDADGKPAGWYFLGSKDDGAMRVLSVVKWDYDSSRPTLQPDGLPPYGYEYYFGEDGRQVMPNGGEAAVYLYDEESKKRIAPDPVWNFETTKINGADTVGAHKCTDSAGEKPEAPGWFKDSHGYWYYYEDQEAVDQEKPVTGWKYIPYHPTNDNGTVDRIFLWKEMGKSHYTTSGVNDEVDVATGAGKFWFAFDDQGRMCTGLVDMSKCLETAAARRAQYGEERYGYWYADHIYYFGASNDGAARRLAVVKWDETPDSRLGTLANRPPVGHYWLIGYNSDFDKYNDDLVSEERYRLVKNWDINASGGYTGKDDLGLTFGNNRTLNKSDGLMGDRYPFMTQSYNDQLRRHADISSGKGITADNQIRCIIPIAQGNEYYDNQINYWYKGSSCRWYVDADGNAVPGVEGIGWLKKGEDWYYMELDEGTGETHLATGWKELPHHYASQYYEYSGNQWVKKEAANPTWFNMRRPINGTPADYDYLLTAGGIYWFYFDETTGKMYDNGRHYTISDTWTTGYYFFGPKGDGAAVAGEIIRGGAYLKSSFGSSAVFTGDVPADGREWYFGSKDNKPDVEMKCMQAIGTSSTYKIVTVKVNSGYTDYPNGTYQMRFDAQGNHVDASGNPVVGVSSSIDTAALEATALTAAAKGTFKKGKSQLGSEIIMNGKPFPNLAWGTSNPDARGDRYPEFHVPFHAWLQYEAVPEKGWLISHLVDTKMDVSEFFWSPEIAMGWAYKDKTLDKYNIPLPAEIKQKHKELFGSDLQNEDDYIRKHTELVTRRYNLEEEIFNRQFYHPDADKKAPRYGFDAAGINNARAYRTGEGGSDGWDLSGPHCGINADHDLRLTCFKTAAIHYILADYYSTAVGTDRYGKRHDAQTQAYNEVAYEGLEYIHGAQPSDGANDDGGVFMLAWNADMNHSATQHENLLLSYAKKNRGVTYGGSLFENPRGAEFDWRDYNGVNHRAAYAKENHGSEAGASRKKDYIYANFEDIPHEKTEGSNEVWYIDRYGLQESIPTQYAYYKTLSRDKQLLVGNVDALFAKTNTKKDYGKGNATANARRLFCSFCDYRDMYDENGEKTAVNTGVDGVRSSGWSADAALENAHKDVFEINNSRFTQYWNRDGWRGWHLEGRGYATPEGSNEDYFARYQGEKPVCYGIDKENKDASGRYELVTMELIADDDVEPTMVANATFPSYMSSMITNPSAEFLHAARNMSVDGEGKEYAYTHQGAPVLNAKIFYPTRESKVMTLEQAEPREGIARPHVFDDNYGKDKRNAERGIHHYCLYGCNWATIRTKLVDDEVTAGGIESGGAKLGSNGTQTDDHYDVNLALPLRDSKLDGSKERVKYYTKPIMKRTMTGEMEPDEDYAYDIVKFINLSQWSARVGTKFVMWEPGDEKDPNWETGAADKFAAEGGTGNVSKTLWRLKSDTDPDYNPYSDEVVDRWTRYVWAGWFSVPDISNPGYRITEWTIEHDDYIYCGWRRVDTEGIVTTNEALQYNEHALSTIVEDPRLEVQN